MQKQGQNNLFKGLFISSFIIMSSVSAYSQAKVAKADTSIIKKVVENKATTASPILITETYDIYSNNCIPKSGSTAEVKSTILNQGCLEVTAEESIDLTESFDAQLGGNFDAKIGVVSTPEPPTPPTPTNAPCEDFTNHSKSGPHLYANTRQNELVGHVFAVNQPEYNAYGVWKKMSKVTYEVGSNRSLWAYREPFNGSTNVHLRTREGCTDYSDVRNTQPESYLGEDANLPNVTPISNYFNINSPIACSSHFDTRNDNSSVYSYSILFNRQMPNLQYRINGGAWKSEINIINKDANGRSFLSTEIPFFITSKDYVLDLTLDGGNTIDRYNVCRNTAGGHFAITNIFTRVQDGTVIIAIQQGDVFTPMQLGEFDSYGGFGNCFNLGPRPDGRIMLPLKGKSTGYVIDENILIQVKSSRNRR